MKKTSRNGTIQSKREAVCKRIEDWVHLRQYIDLLPSDYSYSFECDYSPESLDYESQVSIEVGGQSWIGTAYGISEFDALAEALKRMERNETSISEFNSQFQTVSFVIPH